MDDTAGIRAAQVRCLECGAEPAEARRFCGWCGAPMPVDPVPAEDHMPGPASRAIWRRPWIIAVAAGVAVACLVTALTVLSGRPGTPTRPRASATPATPSATVRWINDTVAGSGPVVAGGTVYVASVEVYALDAATGRPRWTYATGDFFDSGPAVAGDTVYASDGDNGTYALDAGP
jgi:outer membrane protein assembly factor BamB